MKRLFLLLIILFTTLNTQAANAKKYIYNSSNFTFQYNSSDNTDNFYIKLDGVDLFEDPYQVQFLNTDVILCETDAVRASYLHNVRFQTENDLLLGNNVDECCINTDMQNDLDSHKTILQFLLNYKGYVRISFLDKDNKKISIKIPTLH